MGVTVLCDKLFCSLDTSMHSFKTSQAFAHLNASKETCLGTWLLNHSLSVKKVVRKECIYSIDLRVQITMMFLTFSHYQEATDVSATTKTVSDSQQSPLWLVYVGQAITSNVQVHCDHHHVWRVGGTATIIFIGSIAPGPEIKTIDCLKKEKRYIS